MYCRRNGSIGRLWAVLATALLSGGKSVSRVQGLTVVQMIVGVNVSLGLSVS